VYYDVRRLLAFSFPGESGSLLEVIGHDSFLAALKDPALRIRVLDQKATTLDKALHAVVRMSAYCRINVNDTASDSSDRRNICVVKADNAVAVNRQVLDVNVERRLK